MTSLRSAPWSSVDVSARAIAAARGRARRAGFGSAVRFVVGDLTRPPDVAASGAYALDSLMFVPDPARAIRAIGESLEGEGRVFATLILVGPRGAERIRRLLGAAGVRLEAIEEVSHSPPPQPAAASGSSPLRRRTG